LSGTAAGVSLRGRVRAAARCTCAACLKPFTLRLTVDVGEDFGPRAAPAAAAGGGPRQGSESPRHGSAAGPAEERELNAGDFLVPVDAGETIDVTEVVRQHVVLALPIAPRCREECRGLCPRCGTDLNNGPCGCAVDEVDPRLDVLRRWRA
jgi:uncharacterized protein